MSLEAGFAQLRTHLAAYLSLYSDRKPQFGVAVVNKSLQCHVRPTASLTYIRRRKVGTMETDEGTDADEEATEKEDPEI